MRHEYYAYNKEQLLSAPKIPMEVLEDKPAVFQLIAREMADEIKAHNDAGKTTVFICPVGPIGQYPYFVEIVNRERISLKNCWFINMDEYLGEDMQWIPMDHPLSFRGFMQRTVYSQIDPELNVPEDHRVFPDPNNVAYIPQLIEKLGGVDVCFGGIGINGHLAFNEADPTDVYKRQRIQNRVMDQVLKTVSPGGAAIRSGMVRRSSSTPSRPGRADQGSMHKSGASEWAGCQKPT